jgi:5,5'-dehydrodivanillate O-demethylase
MKISQYSDFAHIGPETLAGRFLRRFWQPVYRSDDLVTGRPVRVQIMGEQITLYRGESGAAFALEDRCPHRQTMLSLGGVEGDRIRCFYHGWSFDGAGQCVQQPAEKSSFAAKVKAVAYPVIEYFGLVFAYLGPGEPPEFPRFPELEEAEGVRVVNRLLVTCNYFQRIENDLDEVHVHFVHGVSTKQAGLEEIPEIVVTETEYGIRREGTRTGGGANASRTAHWMMPNVHLVDLPPSPENPYWTIHLAWRVPLDDETMVSFTVSLRRADPKLAPPGAREATTRPIDPNPTEVTADIIAGKLRVQDLDPNYRGLFTVQDSVALVGQGRIVDRSKEWLGQSDKGIILLRRLWERELRALGEGLPLKAWRRPKDKLNLLVTGVRELAEM